MPFPMKLDGEEREERERKEGKREGGEKEEGGKEGRDKRTSYIGQPRSKVATSKLATSLLVFLLPTI